MSANATNIRLGAIVTDFIAGFNQAGAAVGALTTRLNVGLVAGFSAADRASRTFDRGIGRVAGNLTSFGAKASIVTAGLGLLATQTFTTYANINALQLGLENITGSAEGASARFAELREVAKLPGLGLEEAAKGDVRLQAVGFSADKSKAALLQFGNALALTGGGKFELDSVITQLTQMGSKAKVLSEDLKPILTSSPAVARAIKEMFGTVDSEQISAKLQAAGRGPQDFISDLIAKLGELERVKGGPKNALENVGDAGKILQSDLGAAADKAFGLTEKLNALGDIASNLSTQFKTLSPETQKIALTLAGIAAVVGPLALAVGGLLAIVPSVIAGFTAISAVVGVAIGPIVLIGLAIAGLAAIVIANWTSIKEYLTDSGIWNTVSGLVSAAFENIKAVFGVTVSVLTALWDRFGGFIVGTFRIAGTTLLAAFNFISGALQGVFQVLTGVLTLNWRKTWEGFATIGKTVVNGLIDLLRFFVRFVGEAFAAVIQLIPGTNELADKLRSGIDSALGKINGMRFEVNPTVTVLPKSINPTDPTNKKFSAADFATGAYKPGQFLGDFTSKAKDAPFDYSKISLAGSAAKQAADELKKLKDEIRSITLTKGVDAVPAEKLARVKELTAKLKEANTLIKPAAAAKVKPLNEVGFGDLALNERIAKRLALDVQNLGGKAPAELIQQLTAVRAEIERIKALTPTEKTSLPDALRIDNKASLTGRTNQITGSFGGAKILNGATEFLTGLEDAAREKARNLAQSITDIKGNFATLPAFLKTLLKPTVESASALSSGLGTAATTLVADSAKIFGDLKKTLANGAAGAFAAIGESIATGSTAPLQSALKTILGSIADFMIQIGTAMLLASKFLGLAAIFNPTIAPLSIGQGVTGAGLILGGGLIKGLAATAFADGGLVSGPTFSLIGEYSGAKNDPEMVGKLSTVTGYIRDAVRGEMAGNGGGRIELDLRGDSLRSVTRRNEAKRNRVGRA